MRRDGRKTRAFTLVETIFSTLFIGIAVLAIVNLFPGAYLSIRKSEAKLQADIIGKSVMDDLRSINFAYLEPPPVYDDVKVDGMTYKVGVEVLDDLPDDVADSVLKHVRVTVTYRVHLVETKSVHETYLHELPGR